MKELLTGALVVLAVVAIPAKLAGAQAVQPTGQSNPQTRNPQAQPAQNAQNLTAPPTFLQGSSTPQVLGSSINQLSGANFKLAVAKPANYTSEPDAVLTSPQAQLEASRPGVNPKIIIATGTLTLLLGFWAIYRAARRKIT